MNTENFALVSEFDQWLKAENAGHALKHQGFDMGRVKVVGADWLDAIDPGGSRSLAEASILGIKIGLPVSFVLGLVVGLSHIPQAGTGNHILLVLIPVVLMSALGAVLGGLLGCLFGFLGRDSHAPAWAEPEYGNKLRQGSYLVLVQGDQSLVERARLALIQSSPVSTQIKSAKD